MQPTTIPAYRQVLATPDALLLPFQSGRRWVKFGQIVRLESVGNYITGVKAWNGGAKMWHGFTVQTGYRYFIDGCNTGFNTYIIPENQFDSFKNGRNFNSYTDYNQTPGSGPGFFEVKLPPGTYYFVGANNTNASQSIVYEMERWRLY